MVKTFDWHQFVSLADKLMLVDSEDCFRSAVSRAYYGAFCKIREALESEGVYFNDGDVHHALITWLKRQSDHERTAIGKQLDFLRLDRNKADYRGKLPFTRSLAQTSLSRSHWIVDKSKTNNLIK